MDIKTVQKCSEEFFKIKRFAWSEGILDAWNGEAHLTSRMFFNLVSAGNYDISLIDRNHEEYPFRACFVYEDTTYFTILTAEEYQKNIEILGGIDIERVTTA